MNAQRALVVAVQVVLLTALFASLAAQADTPLLYVPLAEPCRLLDTRTSSNGPGPLTQAHGNYQLFIDDVHIGSSTQNGSSTGCGIPAGSTAISANFNLINASASGNIRAWSDDQGPAGPAAGTGVYNPSVSAPLPGEVLYNAGYSTIAVGGDGGFDIAVANGQTDMTINVVGYWRPIGWSVTASGSYSTAMGFNTTAGGFASTAMGSHTQASGFGSTAMGYQTTASSDTSTAMGYQTIASGYGSTAMGSYATVDSGAIGSFVYGDATATVHAGASHQFVVLATGGTTFYSGISGAQNTWPGVSLAAGTGAWSVLSDRAAKDRFAAVDARAILDRVVALPMTTWHYKTQDPSTRHIGAIAQDFYSAFGVGEDERHISTVDADGVALAAIQGLYALVQDKGAEIAKLRAEKDAEIATLRTDLAVQKARVAALESQSSDVAALKAAVKSLQRDRAAVATAAVAP